MDGRLREDSNVPFEERASDLLTSELPGEADVAAAARLMGEIRLHPLEQLVANLDDEENEALLYGL